MESATADRGRPTGDLLGRLAALLPNWQDNAALLDSECRFPATEISDLHRLGGLVAPLPSWAGGLGLGTEPGGAPGLLALLRLVGRGNLAVGRIFEGHVNALKLITIYGSERQIRTAARDAGDGYLFAIWNTEPGERVRLTGDTLHGRKIFCSAAGHATRAVITAQSADPEPRMLIVALDPGERVGQETWTLHGMRACGTGSMVFDGMAVGAGAMLGQPGDYLRQPEFSAGAWRTSAVTLGGLEALVEAARGQLAARRRDGNPHQRARIGTALIAQETASLWLRKASMIAEAGLDEAGDVAGYVNLARIAVETACLDAMRVVQRALGLAGLQQGNPVERISRDLATYLRQPAPDETLDEAAGWFMRRDLPDA